MKNIHQIAIKYLTYLVLNKRKLKNNQAPIDMPPMNPNAHTYFIKNSQTEQGPPPPLFPETSI